MSAFKQKLARLGATAGVLAASTAAIMAIGGVTAGSALAETPKCETVPAVSVLEGEGALLQKVMQTELWIPAYNSACPSGVHFNYTGTSEAWALEDLGYTGEGISRFGHPAFGATEQAPTAAQIATAKAASDANPVIVPVAQTSIAVVANLPADCSITGGITWKDLNKIFAGKIKQWSELETDNGGCGTNPITRVLREDESGVAFQFKNYLSELETQKKGVGPGIIQTGFPGFPAAPVCATRNWSEVRQTGSFANTAWPENRHTEVFGGEPSEPVERSYELGCYPAGTLSPVERVNGGGNVISFVKENVNTIGFAGYPEVVAENGIANVQKLENLSSEGFVKYAAPGTGTETKQANCGGRQYTVPTSSTGLEVDWSAVFGTNPNIGLEIPGTFYPLCTLTFDLSWHDATSGYTSAGYVNGVNVGKAVKDYFANEVLAEGQSLLDARGFQTLPSTGGPSHEVLEAAELAASKIN
jgi:ABC-type phosphate transport system substrate-binding protein